MAGGDIKLLFGVKGGGEISQGTSGANILEQLQGIVKNINAKPLEIKFRADEDSLKQLKNQIAKIMGTISIPVQAVDSSSKTVSRSSSSGTSASGDSEKATERKLSNVDKALTKLESLRHTMAQVEDAIGRNDALDKFAADAIKASDRVAKLTERVTKYNLKTSEFNKQYDKTELAVKKISNAVKEYEKNLKSIDTLQDADGLNIDDKVAATTDALKKLEAVRHQIEMARVGAEKIEDPEVASRYVGEEGSITKLSAKIRDMQQQVESHKMTQSDFNKVLAETSLEAKKVTNSISEYNAGLRKSKDENKFMAMSAKEIRDANEEITKSLKEISDARSKYGTLGLKSGHEDELRSLNDYDLALDMLRKQLNEGTISQEEFNKSMSEIRSGVNTATASLSQYDSRLGSLKAQFDKLSTITKEALGLYSMHMVVSKGVQAIKSMINNAVELESAFADTRIVTHSTTEELKQFGVEITAIANETAASIDSLVSATTAFARLGYSLEESTLLAKYTGMLEKVGNVDTQLAEDAITSIVKAFPDDVTVDNIESTMDKLVKTGNNFPVSVSQLAEGMTNASSALSAAGNDFQQSVALLTAANTTVQNASKASTALRTISARIRKTKSDLDDLGEVMTESQHQAMIQALSDYNVSLVDINGEYRSTYDIMKDIAAQWNNMTSMEQAAIAELVSGTRQQVVFYSLVEHFDEATNAMNAMADSSETLSKSYEIYLGTTAAQLERFDIAWKTFSMDFVNSEMLKGIINVGTGLLNIADRLQRVHLLIPTILAGLTAVKGIKFAVSLAEQNKAIAVMVKSMMDVGVVTESLKQDFLKLSAVQRQKVISDIAMNTSMDATRKETLLLSLQQQNLATSEQLAGSTALTTSAEFATLAASETGAAVATDSLSLSLKTLFMSNPVGIIAMIATSIIALGINIASTRKKAEEAIETVDDLKSSFEELTSSSQQAADRLASISDAADNIVPRFVELSKGIDKFGNKTSELTDDEYTEFVSLSNQLADLFPEISYGMDENGNAMIRLSDDANTLAKSLQAIIDAEATIARTQISDNMQEAIDAYNKVQEMYEPEAITALNGLRSALSGDKSVLGVEAASYIDSIRAISPEIDNIIRKMGRLSQSGSGDFYYTILGNGSMYANESDFYKDLDALIQKTKERVQADLDLQDAQQTVAGSLVMQTAMAWVQNQPAYKDATDVTRDIIGRIIGDIDIEELNITKQADLQAYLTTNILKPIGEMSREAQSSVGRFVDSSAAFARGELNIASMSARIDEVTKSMKKSGMEAETMKTVLDALGATELSDKISTVTDSITGEKDAVQEFVDSLTGGELERAYEILSANGGKMIALDDLKAKLDAVAHSAEIAGKELKDVMSLEGFFTGVKKISKNVNDVVAAMKKLEEGTSLTIEELANLAEQYPELLTQSNLYTDGSIAGQKKLLDTIIECNRLEYESTVKTKIDELKATMKSVESMSAVQLGNALGWAQSLNILSDPNIPSYAKAEFLRDAQVAVRQQIQNEIDNISNWGGDFIQNAIREMEANLARSSGSSYSSGSSSSSGGSSYTAKNDPIGDWVKQNKYKIEIGAQDALYNMADYLVQFAQVIHDNMFNWVVSEEDAKQYIEDLVKGIKGLENDAKTAIDNLVSYRLKTLQDEQKQEEQNAKDRINALKDFYDEQKNLLKEQAKEDDYREEQAEKRKSVSDLQIAIEQIKYDESPYAQKRGAEMQEQLENAQKELDKFERDKALEEAENMLDRQYKEQSAKIEAESNARIAEIQTKINDIDKQLNDPKAFYNQMLDDIKNNSHMIYEQLTEYSGKKTEGVANAEATKVFNEAVKAVEVFSKYLEMNSQKLYNHNGYYVPGSIGANQIVWVFEDDKLVPVISNRGGYASGTTSSTKGLHRIDEKGSEMIFTSSNGNKYRVFSHGEKVLDAESTNFLYKFASSKGRDIITAARAISSREFINENSAKTTNFMAGDIIINGNADERTVSEIRRAQREQMRELLTAFGRMK